MLTTEDGGTSGRRCVKGRVTGPLEAALKKLVGMPVGRHGLRVRPRADARSRGEARRLATISRAQVSVERVMGCGLGGCYSCVVPVKHGDEHANLVRSCISGPVFDGAELVWD